MGDYEQEPKSQLFARDPRDKFVSPHERLIKALFSTRVAELSLFSYFGHNQKKWAASILRMGADFDRIKRNSNPNIA